MLSSICPLGERARFSRWSVTTTAYVLGSLLGGLALGTLAAAAGASVPAAVRAHPVVLSVIAGLFLLGLGLDARPRALPSWRRQVDQRWLTRYRGWVYGFGFGVQLGFGVVTIVTSATTYAVVLAAALSGRPSAGAVIGGVFGLVRALPAVLVARVEDPAALHATFRRVQRWAHPADLLARFGLGAAAAVLVTAAALSPPPG